MGKMGMGLKLSPLIKFLIWLLVRVSSTGSSHGSWFK